MRHRPTSHTTIPRAARVAAAFAAVWLAAAPALSANTPASLLPDDIRRGGVITLATDAGYPPCESLAPDGQTVVGFDADLWNAIGRKLGVRIRTVPTTFSGIISGVESGRYALAMSCITDSPEREQKALFIDYAYGSGAIYTLASNRRISADPLSVCGLKASAEAGMDTIESLNWMVQRCVKHGRPPVQIFQFSSMDGMFSALISRRVDFLINDTAAVDLFRAKLPVPIRVVDSDLAPHRYAGIIVSRGSPALANALLAALTAIQADGTYAQVMQKWRVASLALNQPGVDLATRRPLPVGRP